MGDENPIRTLGDFSKPSHEGYRITIELPEGNNKDPNQHLKDFLKFVDSLDLDVANKERIRLRGQLRKISAEKAWDTIEELARYDDEGWNDPDFPEEDSLNHINPKIKQILGIIESHVDALMKDAISIMKKSKDVFLVSGMMMHHLPSEPSRQEAFEDLVMNFILDQKERVKQLKECMGEIGSDFMQLSLKVA
nr:hypothetical protein [Tanacetum cinerariifolium]